MECGRVVFVRALAHTHEPAKDTLFFFDRCRVRAGASILCKYEGRDVLLSKVASILVFTRAFFLPPL